MNFTTHNQTRIDSSGSCLQGEITATYDELVGLFGKHQEADGYKVDAHWAIRFEDGTVATIYNWKDGKNYCGEDGTPTEQIKDWHIGGFDGKAATQVQIALDLYRESKDAKAEADDPLSAAFSSVEDMLDSIKTHKGEVYVRAVLFGLTIHKIVDIYSIVTHVSGIRERVPGEVADKLDEAHSALAGRLMSAYCNEAFPKDQPRPEPKELIAWVERIVETEQSGVADLVKAVLGNRNED